MSMKRGEKLDRLDYTNVPLPILIIEEIDKFQKVCDLSSRGATLYCMFKMLGSGINIKYYEPQFLKVEEMIKKMIKEEEK